MQIELTWRIAAFVALVVGYLLATQWTHRISHLRLTFFRPWRGDPWPRGVQEETDVTWRWHRPRATKPRDEYRVPVDHLGSVDIHRPDRRG